MDYDIDADKVIQTLIGEAAADPDVIGLVLTSARAIPPVSKYSCAGLSLC